MSFVRGALSSPEFGGHSLGRLEHGTYILHARTAAFPPPFPPSLLLFFGTIIAAIHVTPTAREN